MARGTRSTKKEDIECDHKTEPCLESEEKSQKKVHNSVLNRALNERMYFLSILDEPSEQVDTEGGPSDADKDKILSAKESCFLLTGQTGKLYTVRLPMKRGGRPRCNCPDHLIRKRVCKHILFIAHRVLKLPNSSGSNDDDEIRPSNGFAELSGRHREIRDAVANLRPDSSVRAPTAVQRAFELSVAPELLQGHGARSKTGAEKAQTRVEPRKVEAGDECPICCEQFETDESMLFCTKGCGKGVHEDCMRRYAEAASGGHGTVRCVFCRAEWVFPEDEGASANIERIPRRGVLYNGRLIDLSILASSSFSVPYSSKRKKEQKDDGDNTGEEVDAWGCVDGEIMTEKRKRQKDERDERAKRRAERDAESKQEMPAATGRRTRAMTAKSELDIAEGPPSGKRRKVGNRGSERRSQK